MIYYYSVKWFTCRVYVFENDILRSKGSLYMYDTFKLILILIGTFIISIIFSSFSVNRERLFNFAISSQFWWFSGIYPPNWATWLASRYGRFDHDLTITWRNWPPGHPNGPQSAWITLGRLGVPIEIQKKRIKTKKRSILALFR